MFKEFFLFELKSRLKQPMIYIFMLINFAMLFAATISDNVMIGEANSAVNANAPQNMITSMLAFFIIGIFIVTAFITTSILRDFNNKFDGIIFSTRLTKFGYLGGRFTGAILMSTLPFIAALLGIAIAGVGPWASNVSVGPTYPMSYIFAFLILILPNVIFIGAIVFTLSILFRSTLFAFIGAILVLVLYLVTTSLATDLQSETLAIILDPLMMTAYSLLTKYWTVEEMNTSWLTLSGPFLINRLLWLSVSIALIAFTYFRFSFTTRKSIFSFKSKDIPASKQNISAIPTKLKALPKVQIQENTIQTFKQFLFQSKMEFWGVAKSTPFIIILLFSLFNMSINMSNVNKMFGTGNYPVTYLMIDAIRNSFNFFIIAITMFYAGVIVWRERDAKMNELFDASPFPNWLPFLSKLIALTLICVTMLSAALLCGVVTQILNGYYNFEWSVYLRELLVYDLLGFIAISVLAMFIQTMVNNKYLGYFVFILVMLLSSFLPLALKFESHLISFGSLPNYIYSDMNGWGIWAKLLGWFHSYWLLLSAILVSTSVLFWVRGKALTWQQRLNLAKVRCSGNLAIITFILIGIWISTASFLFYQTKVINTIESQAKQNKEMLEYEMKYKKYQHIAQPRITDIEFDFSFYPKERNYMAKANVIALNKTDQFIDSIHFSLLSGIETTIAIEQAELVLNDKELLYQIFKLNQPLAPGASIEFEVNSSYISKGIENEVSNNDILHNGSFITNSAVMPTIGYNEYNEITDEKKREKNGFSPKERMAKLHSNCSASCSNTYISTDADWVNVSSVVSTSNDQIAIAPGTLTKKWNENDRNYFKYELKQPVLDFYSFVSGRYEISKDVWTSNNGDKVDVEIYYHKGHEYNIDKMISAVKNSLTYYSNNFLPYPHEQARIIEFPRYDTYAQAFPGTMPYSESMGFIANLNDQHAIDMVNYYVAHEMAHQWWAHQVIGANVQGATMLSETFSQYSALMVMQKTYGKEKMKQFMKYEMDKYLRSRGSESKRELPLMFVEDQQYIHYQKGSVVMYALQEYIGEDSLNIALKRYAEAVAYQEPPYTTTLEVLDYIENVTPDNLQYLLDDLFRDITLYSNKVNEADFRQLENGQYEVRINVQVEKYSADSLGKEQLIQHNDYIDIGIYAEEKVEGSLYRKPILVERLLINQSETSFSFIIDELPYEVGIDPNYLLIDRFPEDNMMKL